MGYEDKGLSPRMRGNQAGADAGQNRVGSIPAHAGEPCSATSPTRRVWVYPRACGGTLVLSAIALGVVGLSPRMRGNQLLPGQQAGRQGSIPAHAGEPQRHPRPCHDDRVYPRACGGTGAVFVILLACWGLSPRMRGNHADRMGRRGGAGSIPAHAGEPAWSTSTEIGFGVYPRACGGTRRSPRSSQSKHGLSPRMRGNPGAVDRGRDGAGSIPAHAGEPLQDSHGTAVTAVYPRACGGTSSTALLTLSPRGLSPRMRGNPCLQENSNGTFWSIPAHAGEPGIAALNGLEAGVYPRACGGTGTGAGSIRSVRGLSPRMRGNPL